MLREHQALHCANQNGAKPPVKARKSQSSTNQTALTASAGWNPALTARCSSCRALGARHRWRPRRIDRGRERTRERHEYCGPLAANAAGDGARQRLDAGRADGSPGTRTVAATRRCRRHGSSQVRATSNAAAGSARGAQQRWLGDSASGGERQNDGDDGAIAGFAFDRKHAAVEFDQRLGKRKPEPCPLETSREPAVDLTERSERDCDVILAHVDAGIRHC